jgi:hypothetical protein
MTAPLTREAFWLLDAVVESRIHFSVLVNPRLEEALNRRSHGLTESALVEQVLWLLDRGLIAGWRDDATVAVTADSLRTALLEPGPRFGTTTFYGLTPAGGATWESMARPDWSRFHDGFEGGLEHLRVVEAATTELALRHFERGWSLPLLPEAPKLETLTPWQATYWKQLPRGVRLTGRIDLEATPLRAEFDTSTWYTAPFD